VTRPRFWTSSKFRFDTSSVVPLQSSSCLSPDPVTPGLFLPRSRPCLLDKAAEGGLEPAPASRFRGADPHQLNSCAPPRPFGRLLCSWHTVTAISETRKLVKPDEFSFRVTDYASGEGCGSFDKCQPTKDSEHLTGALTPGCGRRMTHDPQRPISGNGRGCDLTPQLAVGDVCREGEDQRDQQRLETLLPTRDIRVSGHQSRHAHIGARRRHLRRHAKTRRRRAAPPRKCRLRSRERLHCPCVRGGRIATRRYHQTSTRTCHISASTVPFR